RSAWSCLRCPAGSRECRSAQWDVTRPQAERLIAFIGPAVRVVRRPPGLVLKQANRANVAIRTQIEPVPGAARHANQVARFHFDRDDGGPSLFARMDVKQTAAADDEPHLILVMPVLGAEL